MWARLSPDLAPIGIPCSVLSNIRSRTYIIPYHTVHFTIEVETWYLLLGCSNCLVFGQSSPVYRPFELLDAYFFSHLLVVIKPLPVCQVNAFKLGGRVEAVGEPVSLVVSSHHRHSNQTRATRPTSGLNSMNSRPRQSNSRIFCAFGGSECWYGVGAVLMVADDSLCRRGQGVRVRQP